MNKFLEKMQENLDTLGNKIALVSSGDRSVMTYAQLNEISGRVYAYLKNKGIGKDNVVMVCLPRNLTMFPAMIGVWKAGAAYVLCEDTMAPERIKFTEQNSDAVISITMDNWRDIMNTPSLPGRETVAAHDLAYLVYTSGTTGNPKGVAHEYGNLEQSIAAKNIDGEHIYTRDDILSLTSPFQVNANIEFPVQMWYIGGTLVLMDYAHTKNPAMLIEKYEQYGVTTTFMTPSLYRSCGRMNSQMRSICLGGEPTVNMYSDTVQLYNAYNMSEAGRDILIFKIDKPYGVTPVGKNMGGDRVYLLKDDGTEAAAGEQGEICFENGFVRGYMHLPEKTAEAWRDGLFHTNDIGELLEDGNIVLKGRSDDMIKINGNRIEPAEIEVVSQELLGLTKPCAKGFITEKQSFVVLYYTDDVEIDPAEARAKLETRLNYYMIPSYFVHLDEYPLLPSGKLNKKALQAPDISAYRKEYAAPRTAAEKKLCAVMEKVLGLDRIGIDDDFYELGGDSLSSMEVVMEYDDPALDAATMFRYRTVREIAVRIEEATIDDELSLLEKDARARRHEQPLLPAQRFMLDYLLYTPNTTVYNMPSLWKIKNADIDAEKLARAVETALDDHPIFRTKIYYNRDVELVQKYDPRAKIAVNVEYVTEAEFEEIRKSLVQPYPKLMNTLLYRIRIFKTEENVYYFFDMNHVLSDGTSLALLQDHITKAYYGEPLPHDYYYLTLRERARECASDVYKEARAYYTGKYAAPGWAHTITPDIESRENLAASRILPMPMPIEEMEELAKKAGGSANAIAIAAILLTLRDIEKKDRAFVKWLYHARGTGTTDSCVGPLYRHIITGVDFKGLRTTKDLVAEVNKEISTGIRYYMYPFAELMDQVGSDEILIFGNEGTLMESSFIKDIPAEQLPLPAAHNTASILAVMLAELPGVGQAVMFVCNETRYSAEKVQKFIDTYCDNCLKILRGGEI